MDRWEQMAYVLHIEPFKETSGLVSFLTQGRGLVTTIARGIKRRRRGQTALQPFITWQIAAQGSRELLTLRDYQPQRYWPRPRDYASSVACLYVHELLICLLRKNAAGVGVFMAYEQVLEALLGVEWKRGVNLAPALRVFEKRLLAALGYALPLTQVLGLNTPVLPDQYYAFDPLIGPRLVSQHTPGAVRGLDLWALEHEQFETPQQLHTAKKIMRLALRAQLGEKTLQSQRLWLGLTGKEQRP